MENILFDEDGTQIIDKIEKNNEIQIQKNSTDNRCFSIARSELLHMQPTIFSREYKIGR